MHWLQAAAGISTSNVRKTTLRRLLSTVPAASPHRRSLREPCPGRRFPGLPRRSIGGCRQLGADRNVGTAKALAAGIPWRCTVHQSENISSSQSGCCTGMVWLALGPGHFIRHGLVRDRRLPGARAAYKDRFRLCLSVCVMSAPPPCETAVRVWVARDPRAAPGPGLNLGPDELGPPMAAPVAWGRVGMAHTGGVASTAVRNVALRAHNCPPLQLLDGPGNLSAGLQACTLTGQDRRLRNHMGQRDVFTGSQGCAYDERRGSAARC
jgi:hypothetical protein